jgi:hypothetical protein
MKLEDLLKKYDWVGGFNDGFAIVLFNDKWDLLMRNLKSQN